MGLEHDQLDFSNVAALEHIARRIFQIEVAVKRHPGQPESEGLSQ